MKFFVCFSGTKCGDCGQRFKDYIGLMDHMQNTHLRIDIDDEITVIPSGPSSSFGTSSMPKTVQSTSKPAQSSSNQSQVPAQSSSVSEPEASTPNSLDDDDDLIVVLECINKNNNNSSNKSQVGLTGKSQDGLKNKSQVQPGSVSLSAISLKGPQSSRLKSCFTNPKLTITKISNGTQGQKTSGNEIAKKSSQDFASEARPHTATANSTLNKTQTPMPSNTPNSSSLTSNLSRQSQSSPGSKSSGSGPQATTSR